MSEKRHVALLIPYRKHDGILHYFLQKRDAGAPLYPNQFGFFGGHVEPGEEREHAVVREVEEELMYVPPGIQFYRRIEHNNVIRDVFVVEVEADFEERVTVCEGEYGAFRTFKAVENDPLVSEGHRAVLKELDGLL
jgi:8-oxo-dGTP pyrophosphatase MutT (NUDIX family)